MLQDGAPAAEEARALFDRLQPTLPIVLANLVSVGEIAAVYRGNIEQLLVLLPQGAAAVQAVGVANRNTKQAYNGGFLSFNLNLNLPPACNTGFLPAQQIRAAALEDYPPAPDGDLYCRVPQDSPFNVRGARNTPCVEKPGKRAPTVAICESDENYVPLNDGYNWKGDPNATLSGQAMPSRGIHRRRGLPRGGCTTSASGCTGTGSSGAVRPFHRKLRRTGRTRVHAVGPCPRCPTGTDMAKYAGPAGKLTPYRKGLGSNQIRSIKKLERRGDRLGRPTL